MNNIELANKATTADIRFRYTVSIRHHRTSPLNASLWNWPQVAPILYIRGDHLQESRRSEMTRQNL